MDTSGNRRGTRCSVAAIATIAGLLAIGAAPAAAGKTWAPKRGTLYHGVSDTGHDKHYYAFNKAVGAHTAVMQGFEVWGRSLDHLYRRWGRTRTRGMISISTAPGFGEKELATPRGIAKGRRDAYMTRMARDLARRGKPVYIRLFAEMNGHWNPYSAYNEDGSRRGRTHRQRWFKQAWRRFRIVMRGGPRRRVNRKLRRLGLPRVQRQGLYRNRVPKRLPRPKVALMWVPQSTGSPNIRGNGPRAYWPGARYVDWVGVDMYSKFPNFPGMLKVYKRFRRKPFVIGEYGPWDVDSGAWMGQIHRWARLHKRTRLLVYYQGFGEVGNPHRIQDYPSSRRKLRRILKRKRYIKYAPEERRRSAPPPSGGVRAGRG